MDLFNELKLAIYESGFDDETTQSLVSDLEVAYEYGTAHEFAECVNMICDAVNFNALIVSESVAENLKTAGSIARNMGYVSTFSTAKSVINTGVIKKSIEDLEKERDKCRARDDREGVAACDNAIRELKSRYALARQITKNKALVTAGLIGGGTAAKAVGNKLQQRDWNKRRTRAGVNIDGEYYAGDIV